MRYLRTKSSVGLVLMLVLMASVALLRADPGDLDLTFGGGDGYVTTDINPDTGEVIFSMVVDGNGRIIVAGTMLNYTTDFYRGIILRYNVDGTVDETFGDQGITMVTGYTEFNDIVIDTSGRILVAGYGTQGALIVRLNPDGTLDPTFGDQGMVIEDAWKEFFALYISADHKITVAGEFALHCFYTCTGLSRYLPDGDVDVNFGYSGSTRLIQRANASFSILPDADGGTLLIGSGHQDNTNNSNILLVRYLADGDLDLNFGVEGVIAVDINEYDQAQRAVRDNENRILVVGGTSPISGFYDAVILRYLPDGTLDTTFGENGTVLMQIPDAVQTLANTIMIDSSNRIIITGMFSVEGNANQSSYVARYNIDGVLDTSFGGGDGISQFALPEYLYSLDGALDAQDNIVVGGSSNFNNELLLVRYEGGDLPATATPTATDTATATETLEPTATFTATNTLTPTQTATDSPTLTATIESTFEPTETTTPDTGIDLVVNGGFESDLTGWQVKNLTQDKVKCDKAEKPVAYEGECAFRFKGSVGENSQLFQKLDLAGQTFSVDDVFTLQAYIHARGQVDFQVQAKFTYADDTKEKIAIDLSAATDGYTVFADDYTLTDASLVKVKVALKNKSTSGKVDVDAVRLNYVAAGSSLLPLP